MYLKFQVKILGFAIANLKNLDLKRIFPGTLERSPAVY
jgi:hypothetical protein